MNNLSPEEIAIVKKALREKIDRLERSIGDDPRYTPAARNKMAIERAETCDVLDKL